MKHESPPLPAGFFLSTSSLAIQGVKIGAMAPVLLFGLLELEDFFRSGA
jgi:hypothetical protein